MRVLHVIGTTVAVIGMIIVFIIMMASSLTWIVLRRTPADVWLWLVGPR